MTHLLLALVLSAPTVVLSAPDPPGDLRCEWRINPTDVRDPCPELYWEVADQSAFRAVVAASSADLERGARAVWDSGKVHSPLPIVEYAGPRLENGRTYFWRLQVWDDARRALPLPPPQRFSLRAEPMPHHLPTARTFINFGGTPDFARDWLDLCFRKEAKQGRASVLTTTYALVCTMVLPHPSTARPLSGKAKQLADLCVERGLTTQGILEDMFCHFAADTRVRLHVGAERAANPVEERVCPGWDPRNDRNGDGRVDDAEFADLVNPEAHARQPREARIPIYYWGPPRDDFVMNVGHPAYREFMASVHAPSVCEGYDGIYFDTVPTDVAGPGRSARVLEYPRQGRDADKWLRDLQMMFARMKINLPDKIITANNWDANPMVIDGRQSEGWQGLTRQAGQWRARIDSAVERDRRGKIQLIQYNPIFHPTLAEFGPRVPVSHDRDKLFGLATYYMAHGDFTYFGFGRHPYGGVQKQWFEAIRYDIGEPEGDYYLSAQVDTGADPDAPSHLANGDFELGNPGGDPEAWTAAEPVELDAEVRRSGRLSARIASADVTINNINKQYVRLKPDTTYTLIAWAKTENVRGSPGAQVYPYEFDGATGGAMLTWIGTSHWREQRTVFTTGADADGRINFRIYGATGTAWFDDIQLLEGAHIAQQVFARNYTTALVLVKPYTGGPFGDSTATTHRLPRPLRPLRADGTLGDPTDDVTLRSAEAAILVP
ncbi:MAG: putative glycoside hydrolase [Armatimonadota bacterium]|jgi:hypothetical protein